MAAKLKKTAKRLALNGLIKGAYICHLNSVFGNNCDIDSAYVSKKAELSHSVRIGRETRIGDGVRIGQYTYVMPYSIVLQAEIGAFCSIGGFVSIGGWQHPLDRLSTSPRLYREILGTEYHDDGKHVVIGNDVWIGDGAIVLSGNIGNGAVIGAGAVVTRDVEPYSVVAGIPAVKIKNRPPDGSDVSWWEWDPEKIRENAQLFLNRSSDSISEEGAAK